MHLRLRRILAGMILIAVAGAGYVAYWHFFGSQTLRVAVAAMESEDALLLSRVAEWMSAQNRRYRLRLVPSGSESASLAMLKSGEADVVSARSDSVSGPGASSVIVLYQEAAVLAVPAKSTIESWRDLNHRKVGLVGRTVRDDPMLAAIFKASGAPDPQTAPVELAKVAGELQKRTLQALIYVGPVVGTLSGYVHQSANLQSIKASLEFIEIADAEAIARADRRYTDMTILPGGIRTTPPLPAESLLTLAAPRHLLVRSTLPNYKVAGFLRELLEVRRSLRTELPLLAQTEAPDLEAGAHVPVHTGARKLFNAEELALSDLALDLFYIIPMLVGGIGAFIVWLLHFLWPDKRLTAEDLARKLMAVRLKAGEATTLEEWSAARKALDRVIAAADRQAGEGKEDPESTLLLTTALDSTERWLAMKGDDLAKGLAKV